jgi:hypothetical protein
MHGALPGTSEPFFEEVGGFRQSPGSVVPSSAGPELRPLPSTGVTRPPRYYEPVRHPKRPGLSLAGFQLRSCVPPLGLPVLRTFPLCRHAAAITPVGPLGRIARGTAYSNRFPVPQRRRPSPANRRVGSHIHTFEACSAFTHVAACPLAAPLRYTCLEGSDGFMASTAASIASGWNDRVSRAGFAPAGKRRLSTAHC